MHRVGRTARAGCGGRAVTLVTESMRLLMKQIVADVEDKSSIKSRVIPPGTAHPPSRSYTRLFSLSCVVNTTGLAPLTFFR